MAYISSKANRFYTAVESGFGQVAAVSAANRIPAVKLSARQQMRTAERKDKTGSRTFVGLPPGGRRRTQFDLRTYMTTWSDPTQEPGYGPMFQACLGATPLIGDVGVAGAGSSGNTVVFTGPHGLVPGQAVTSNGEMRFVEAVVNDTTVTVNAPFTITPGAGAAIGATCTYFPATELPSATIFDYWSPATAVQRILCGAAVNRMEVAVNGDFHEFHFSGLAQDLLDSSSFTAGLGALDSFPEEPALEQFDYSIIPGHMGQAWLGSTPSQFYTITSATFTLDNNLDLRAREFGSNVPKCISPGQRSVTVDFELYGLDDDATKGLYQAARQGSPVSVMFQLGEQEGQLMGVYLKSVTPEVPEFEDSEARLRWKFSGSRAQGTADDEIAVAFG
ncbi:MAG TPA: hypothetical protein VN442_17710 [Bryobacteraceae bacterium]|nr:hypothetical protein [Bryobacteraceae bacterium]